MRWSWISLSAHWSATMQSYRFGDRAEVLVVDRDLAADAAEHRREADVDAGEDDDRRAVAGQPLDRVLEPRRDLVGVGAGPDDVVAARRDRDEVGLQRERRLELLVDDLLDELAAHREVRVGEVVDVLREHLGDAVGPAAVTAGHGRLGVADALRERIAEGDVAGPGMLLRDHALHCAKPSRFEDVGPLRYPRIQ